MGMSKQPDSANADSAPSDEGAGSRSETEGEKTRRSAKRFLSRRTTVYLSLSRLTATAPSSEGAK